MLSNCFSCTVGDLTVTAKAMGYTSKEATAGIAQDSKVTVKAAETAKSYTEKMYKPRNTQEPHKQQSAAKVEDKYKRQCVPTIPSQATPR